MKLGILYTTQMASMPFSAAYWAAGHPVIPRVQQVDLGKALGQEGRQGVRVGIPDQQELAAVSGVLIPDDAQGLVAAQEGGVFVLLGQIAPVVQYAGFRRAGAPGGDREARPPLPRIPWCPASASGCRTVEYSVPLKLVLAISGVKLSCFNDFSSQDFQQSIGPIEGPEGTSSGGLCGRRWARRRERSGRPEKSIMGSPRPAAWAR